MDFMTLIQINYRHGLLGVWGTLQVIGRANMPVKDRPLAVEDHPLYPKWLKALEDVIRTKEALDICEEDSSEWMGADADYQAALMEYESVGRSI